MGEGAGLEDLSVRASTGVLDQTHTFVRVRGSTALVVKRVIVIGSILRIDVPRHESHLNLIGRDLGGHVDLHDTFQAFLHPH